jgi:predicted dehydrogenase
MDYTATPLIFRLRKALRYLHLYGLRRTIVKVRGQYHMRKRYATLPGNDRPAPVGAHVGLIGCGNYAFSVIAYYLRRNHGSVIRGCMDVDINHAASLFEHYQAAYYTSDPDRIIADPEIDLVFIASNHASHAEYAIKALDAGKDVHIEKPHVVTSAQLERLVAAAERSSGRVLSLGYNRPRSRIGRTIRETLWAQPGELMQNWFIAGHEIADDHWYFQPAEGGRVLGNLCHWTDLTMHMMPPERRFPIRITPTRSAKSDCDIAVTFTFGDGSIGIITFSAKGHAFEGVKERYAAHRGDALIAMDDFQSLRIDVVEKKTEIKLRSRDHGHAASIKHSYEQSRDRSAAGCPIADIWETGALFLLTKEALETDRILEMESYAATFAVTSTGPRSAPEEIAR